MRRGGGVARSRLRLATKYAHQRGRCGRNWTVAPGSRSVLRRLHPQRDGFTIRVQRIRMGFIQIHHHAGYGWIGAVETQAHGVHAVGIQGKVFLFGVGESTGEHKYKPVGVGRRLHRRLYCSGQDDLDRDIGPVALNLQLLDLGRATCWTLCRAKRPQEQEHN